MTPMAARRARSPWAAAARRPRAQATRVQRPTRRSRKSAPRAARPLRPCSAWWVGRWAARAPGCCRPARSQRASPVGSPTYVPACRLPAAGQRPALLQRVRPAAQALVGPDVSGAAALGGCSRRVLFESRQSSCHVRVFVLPAHCNFPAASFLLPISSPCWVVQAAGPVAGLGRLCELRSAWHLQRVCSRKHIWQELKECKERKTGQRGDRASASLATPALPLRPARRLAALGACCCGWLALLWQQARKCSLHPGLGCKTGGRQRTQEDSPSHVRTSHGPAQHAAFTPTGAQRTTALGAVQDLIFPI